MRFTTVFLACIAVLSALCVADKEFNQHVALSNQQDVKQVKPTWDAALPAVAATTRILSETNAAYNEDEQPAAAAAQTSVHDNDAVASPNQRLVPRYARRQHWVNKVTPWIAPAVSAGLGAYKLYSAVEKRRLTETKARQTHDDQQPSTDEEQPVVRPRRGISARRQNWLSKAAPYVGPALSGAATAYNIYKWAKKRRLSEMNVAHVRDEEQPGVIYEPSMVRPRKARRQNWFSRAVGAGIGAYKLYSAFKKRRLGDVNTVKLINELQATPATNDASRRRLYEAIRAQFQAATDGSKSKLHAATATGQ
ncbi:unnamed protein product [Aphanomyces euteiches]